MDVSSTATAYAAFSGVLAGFSFTGLSFYVTRAPEREISKYQPARNGVLIQIGIPVNSVAATGFYAMVSLTISTLLYSNLAGASGADSPAAKTVWLVYGVVFALSILALLYFITLILFERPLTRRAAKPAFWASTIAGSLMALRFIAESARTARISLCPPKAPCHPGWFYDVRNITIMLAAAAFIFVTTILTNSLERKWFTQIFKKLVDRPQLPARAAFYATFAIAMASLYFGTWSSEPPAWVIPVSYGFSVLLVLIFAVASGSTVYPRIIASLRVGLTEPLGTATTDAPEAGDVEQPVPPGASTTVGPEVEDRGGQVKTG